MSLSPEQKKFYENTLQVTKRAISELEDLIQQELAKVKDRLAELQNAQKAARQMYHAARMRLAIRNDLGEDEAHGRRRAGALSGGYPAIGRRSLTLHTLFF